MYLPPPASTCTCLRMFLNFFHLQGPPLRKLSPNRLFSASSRYIIPFHTAGSRHPNALLQGSSFIVFPEFSLLPPFNPLRPSSSPFSLCHHNKSAFAQFCETLSVADGASISSPLGILGRASKSHPSVTISYNTCESSENGRLYNTQVGTVVRMRILLEFEHSEFVAETFTPGHLARGAGSDILSQTASVVTCDSARRHALAPPV
jgi:hypothetical protein